MHKECKNCDWYLIECAGKIERCLKRITTMEGESKVKRLVYIEDDYKGIKTG